MKAREIGTELVEYLILRNFVADILGESHYDSALDDLLRLQCPGFVNVKASCLFNNNDDNNNNNNKNSSY